MSKSNSAVSDPNVLAKAWELLDSEGRRSLFMVLLVALLSAGASALMVFSVFPFLTVLSDASRVEGVPKLQWIYDELRFDSRYGFLIFLGCVSFASIVVSNVLLALRTYVATRFSAMRTYALSRKLLSTYLRQPYEFFLDRHSGEMGTRILSEAAQVVSQFYTPVITLAASLMTTIALITVLMFTEPLVSLIALLVLGATYGGTYRAARSWVQRLASIRLEANQQRFRMANEALSGIKEIKVLGRERSYLKRFSDPARTLAETQVRVNLISGLPQYVIQIIAFGGIILLSLVLLDEAGLESGKAMADLLPFLGMFAFAGQRLLPELQKLYQAFTRLQVGGVAVNAIHEDMHSRRVSTLPQRQPEPMPIHGGVVVRKVSYRYPNAEKSSLSSVDFEMRPGERIGVVGSTGAGKTTLADIVLGLLYPSEGGLYVDGVEITQGNRRAWQGAVGYVPQDIYLIDASISENIAFGISPDEIDRDRVREVARAAQVDQLIEQDLPAGYETHVGERGVRLSGGQRQRIGIARALYHDASLIVFDEATSALDNLTEKEVMLALNALPGDKVVFMIAHRLSTVMECDRILVLDQGAVVGFDNWEALMRTCEHFRRMARLGEVA